METEDPRRPAPRPAPGIYSSFGPGATPLCREVLRPLIAARGPLSFEQFMDLALYHPAHGYYSDPDRHRIGRHGDFATNVSVGPTFGRLLALRLHQLWTAHDSPAEFAVAELGPEDGTLALDILAAARRHHPEFRAALRYTALEPSPRKRAALDERFAAANEANLAVVSSPADHRATFGAVLANEVLDALPVRALRFSSGRWLERRVTCHDRSLGWTDAPIDDAEEELRAAVAALGTAYPDDYQTELCLRLDAFFRDVAGLLDRGLFLFIDYGFPRSDYYHPDRTRGTLQTYAAHRVGDDPLDSPGRRDLTAHVDFTRATEAARAAGLLPLGAARQESYFVHLASDLLRDSPQPPDSEAFLPQFRTLTHPAFFGSAFHVLEFTKGDLAPAFTFPGQPNQPHDPHGAD